MSAFLEVDDLSVIYGATTRGGEPFRAVSHASFGIEKGQTLGLVGASGCGKSTIARVVAGLTAPTSGRVVLGGQALMSPRPRADARRIQMVFQDPSSALNPSMTVGATLTELLLVHREARTKKAAVVRSEELLEMVGLGATALAARPRELSGGQRQRVGIARALALRPDVLIADESVSALDVSVQASVLNTLRRLKHELDLTMLFISHDLAVTRLVSDHIAVMNQGSIVESGPRDVVISTPHDPYTQRLLAAAPQL